jgi:hypothetical protein
MKKNDKGMTELLNLLTAHPELIRELVFDQAKIRKLLRHKSARRLIRGGGPTAFLEYISGPADGAPVAYCWGGTRAFCAKGTGQCLGGTRPPPQCLPTTMPVSPGCLRGTAPSPGCLRGTTPSPG